MSPRERGRFLETTRRVSLSIKQVLYEPAAPIKRVYFPVSGVISLVTILSDGSGVEMATVGREGMAGVPVFLGVAISGNVRAIAQVPGESLSMDAEVFRAESSKSGILRDVMQHYTQATMTQAAQEVACNRLHSSEERCSRWLLMTHDRVGADEFPLTQEFLAEMLGMRRASVTVAAGILQKAGFISYRRGQVVILDREGLESASCECYDVIRAEFGRLLPGSV